MKSNLCSTFLRNAAAKRHFLIIQLPLAISTAVLIAGCAGPSPNASSGSTEAQSQLGKEQEAQLRKEKEAELKKEKEAEFKKTAEDLVQAIAFNGTAHSTLRGYAVGVTTESEFLKGMWNCENPLLQRVGLLSFTRDNGHNSYDLGYYDVRVREMFLMHEIIRDCSAITNSVGQKPLLIIASTPGWAEDGAVPKQHGMFFSCNLEFTNNVLKEITWCDDWVSPNQNTRTLKSLIKAKPRQSQAPNGS